MNTASVTYGIVSSSTYVQMELQKERRERVKQKKSLKKLWLKIFQV